MPRDYADKFADALGAGFDSCTARTYAGGAFALRYRRSRCRAASLRRVSRPLAEPEEEEDQEASTDDDPGFDPAEDYEE